MFRACFQLLFSSLLFLYFCCLFTLRGWHFGECATLLSILLSLSRLKVMATGQHSHPVAIISQTTSPASPASRDFCGEYVSFQEHSAGRLGDLGKTLRGLSRKPSFIRVRPSWRVRKMSDDRTRQRGCSFGLCFNVARNIGFGSYVFRFLPHRMADFPCEARSRIARYIVIRLGTDGHVCGD